MDETRPGIAFGHANNLDDFRHLVALERHCLLTVHFCLFAFEDGAQREQLGEDAAYGPQIDRDCVVAGSQEEVRGAVPNRDDDFIAAVEGGEGFIEAAG